MITAVLLAAGESRRMGAFKQVLPLGGKTFVERCVDTLLASRADELIVVTGHREAEVRAAIGNRPVRCVYNPDYRSGMSGSIKQALLALSSDTRAIMIALVDQPLVDTKTVNQLIEAYVEHQPAIVVPSYQGRKGHPIILDVSLRDEILAIDPNQGLRQVVHAHSERILHVEVQSNVVLVDADYPEEYEQLKEA